MNRDHVGLWKKQGDARKRDMRQIDVKIAYEARERQMISTLEIGRRMSDEAVTGNKILKQALLIGQANQYEFMRRLNLLKSAEKIADVRADAKVQDAPDINGNTHLH
jgi:hypothetical protein